MRTSGYVRGHLDRRGLKLLSFALKDFESGRAFSKRCSTNNKRSLSFNYTTTTQASSLNISKKRKFVADGVFFAELNEMLVRELAEDGYSGVEVRSTPVKMEIIIRATKTQNVLGEKGRRIRELTSLVQKRFGFE